MPHRNAIIIALPLFLAVTVNAQPVASDGCMEAPANAYMVGADCMPFLLPHAFGADLDPGGCGNLSDDAFGWFTATSDSTTIGMVPNNNADIGLQVFSGSCGTLSMIDCADAQGPAGLEELTVHTVPGSNYLVRVQTLGALDSLPAGLLCIFETPPPPVNSDPCSGTLLPVTTTCNGVVSGTNVSSYTTPGMPVPPCYHAGASGDVWFKAVVPGNGHLIIDTQSLIPFDGAMATYTTTDCADPAQYTYMDCDDDGSSTANWMPMLNMSGLTPGDTVYIRFWAFDGDEEDFRICASSGITTLPVEFLGMQATANGNAVEVNWATASEEGSARFDVQRGMDPDLLTTIGSVPAAGWSQQRLDYTFKDHSATAGLNYYRVREVDQDGAELFTPVTAVLVAGQGERAVAVYPNPVGDVLHLAFEAGREGQAQVAVLDLAGQALMRELVQVRQGGVTLSLDARGLATGCYRAQVTLPSGSMLPGSILIKR